MKGTKIMSEKEFNAQDLEKKIRSLPEMEQKAMCWLISNIEIAEQLAAGEKMTEGEVKRLTQTAIEKKDYVLLALVLYKENKDKSEKDKQQS